MRVRVTSRSKPAGDPYGLRGAPAIVMPGGTSGGAAALSLAANAMKAPAAAAPPFKKTLRSSSPFPAARASLSPRSSRRVRMAPSRPGDIRIYSDEHDGASFDHRAARARPPLALRSAAGLGDRE